MAGERFRTMCRPGMMLAAVLWATSVTAQQPVASEKSPEGFKDSSRIAEDGTAYVTRIVPVPSTISPEAQKMLAKVVPDAAVPFSVAQSRIATEAWQAGAGEVSKRMYPANVEAGNIAGVPVRIVTPLAIAPEKRDRVLINLHGGGFNSDAGSLTETIPIASLTGIKVVAVLYRLAPEHPFPAAVDDAVAVYKELLKTYKPGHIGLYGTSAGAILTAEVTVKLKQLGLPLPTVTGVFSAIGDFSRLGDSFSLFNLSGLSGHLDPPKPVAPGGEYTANTDKKDPVLSPIYADLTGFPPTLFVTSGRDFLASGTTTLHRAYLRGGVDAQLVEFEALPHAFWNTPDLPESKEADQIMAKFLESHLAR